MNIKEKARMAVWLEQFNNSNAMSNGREHFCKSCTRQSMIEDLLNDETIFSWLEGASHGGFYPVLTNGVCECGHCFSSERV